MKTVTGKVISSEPISLFKAAKLLSGFVSSDNGASQAINAYLRRASTAFTELKNLHKEIRSSSSSKETRSGSEVRHERNPRVELEEVGGDKEIDDLVENQKSEIVSEAETKEKKKSKKKKKKEEDVVEEQREEERKEKKRKSDGEIGSEEKKSKKKRKSKEIDG